MAVSGNASDDRRRPRATARPGTRWLRVGLRQFLRELGRLHHISLESHDEAFLLSVSTPLQILIAQAPSIEDVEAEPPALVVRIGPRFLVSHRSAHRRTPEFFYHFL